MMQSASNLSQNLSGTSPASFDMPQTVPLKKGRYALQIDDRNITLCIRSEHPVGLVVWITQHADEADLLRSCARHSCRMFNLAIVEVKDWNDELSPWPAAKCMSADDVYAGNASLFLEQIEKRYLPDILEKLPASPSWIGLVGYSMAGLFALYASHQPSEYFTRFASVSGSLWYPDFEEWYVNTPFPSNPKAVYLSLGTKESKSSNPYLSTTADRTQSIAKFLAAKNTPCTFEWNPGNHFQNPDARLARAIAWLCRD